MKRTPFQRLIALAEYWTTAEFTHLSAYQAFLLCSVQLNGLLLNMRHEVIPVMWARPIIATEDGEGVNKGEVLTLETHPHYWEPEGDGWIPLYGNL
jgi:hypothetical protein